MLSYNYFYITNIKNLFICVFKTMCIYNITYKINLSSKILKAPKQEKRKNNIRYCVCIYVCCLEVNIWGKV